MSDTGIENLIEEGVNEQLKGVVMATLVSKADTITLAKLAELRESPRYGAIMEHVTLADLFKFQELDQTETEEKAPAPVKKRKKKKSSAEASKESEAEVKKINFRDPTERETYASQIEQMISERAGEPVSTSELTDVCGGSSNQAREILRELVDAGLVVWTGQARATRYYWKNGAAKDVLAEFRKVRAAEKATGT